MTNQRISNRRNRALVGAAIAVSVTLILIPHGSASADDGARSRSESYEGPLRYQPGACGESWGDVSEMVFSNGKPHFGFETFPGESTVDVAITSANPDAVVAAFVNQTGRAGDGVLVCGRTSEPLPIEQGRSLYLWIFQLVDDPEQTSTKASVAGGRVDATFYRASDEPEPLPSPSPTPQPVTIERTLNFALRGHLRAHGAVMSAEQVCQSGVDVVIERRTSDGWSAIRAAATATDGTFKLRLPDRPGRYRALAPELTYPDKTCLQARSRSLRHGH